MSSEHETRERDPLLRLLRELPDHKAPATLVGRVQGAIRARAPLPWWRRPLTEWPPFTRFLGVACGLAASAAILWFGAALVGDIAGTASGWVLRNGLPVMALGGQVVGAFWKVAAIVLGRMPLEAWGCAGLAGVLVYTSGLGIGTVFWKVANHRS